MKLIYRFLTVAFLASVLAGALSAAAAEEPCPKLTALSTAEEKRYGVSANVYGPMAFADIECAIYWRKNKLCAMESTFFDSTAKVVDHSTGAEVEMAKAHFVVESTGHAWVPAFAERGEAERFVAESDGIILDYVQLRDR